MVGASAASEKGAGGHNKVGQQPADCSENGEEFKYAPAEISQVETIQVRIVYSVKFPSANRKGSTVSGRRG